jgi:hypothetical protein
VSVHEHSVFYLPKIQAAQPIGKLSAHRRAETRPQTL